MKKLFSILFFLPLQVCLYSQELNPRPDETIYILIEASRLKMFGNFEEAEKLYKACIQNDPESGAAWYELASIYSITGRLDLAEEYIKNAYNLDGNNYWYLIAYADVLNMNEKYNETVKILREGIRKLPEEEIYFRLEIAENLVLDNKNKKALKELNVIEKKFGISEVVTVKKIEVFKQLNKHSKIIQSYEKMLTNDEENVPVLLMYAQYLMESGYEEKAKFQYEKVIYLDGANIFAISNLADIYGRTGDIEKSYLFLTEAFMSEDISMEKKLQTLAYIMHDQKRVEGNKKEIKKLVEAVLEADQENYELLLIVYDFYYKTEDYIQSFEIIKKLLKLRDDNFIIWMQALFTANLLEDYEELIEIGNNALKIFPNKDDIRVFMAMAFYQLKNHNQAYLLLKETQERFTEPELAKQKNILLAETAYKNGFVEEAFSYFDNLIESEPDNIYVKNNYSYYMSLEEVNLDLAKELSYETIVAEPENPTFLDTYGWILYKRGEYREAEIFLKKAYELNESESEEIINHYIEILKVNDKINEAENIREKLKNE